MRIRILALHLPPGCLLPQEVGNLEDLALWIVACQVQGLRLGLCFITISYRLNFSGTGTGSATPPHDDPEQLEEEQETSFPPREDDDLSSMSEESGKDWKPEMSGKLAWLHRYCQDLLVLFFVCE